MASNAAIAERICAHVLERLRAYWSWTFLCGALWCGAAGFWNCCVQIWLDQTFWRSGARPAPLPDLAFLWLPYIRGSHLADVYMQTLSAVTIVGFVLFHPDHVRVIKRYLFIQGCMFWIRSVTIFVTVLPSPYEYCVNRSRVDEWVWLEALKIMLGLRVTCNDVLYSGHTVTITLSALLWDQYLPEKTVYYVVRLVVWLVAFVGYFIIVGTHFHYSCDVVIGAIIAILVWRLYHMALSSDVTVESLPWLAWYEERVACRYKRMLPPGLGLYDPKGSGELDVPGDDIFNAHNV